MAFPKVLIIAVTCLVFTLLLAGTVNALSIVGQSALSDSVIKITTRDKYDFNSVLDFGQYSITSTEDSDFSSPRNPVQIGRQSYVIDFVGSRQPTNHYGDMNSPIKNYEIYLVFGQKLKNGKRYTLTISNIKDAAGNSFAAPQTFDFIYNDLNLVSGSIKASHVGYLPDSPKFGYIGNYLGDAGALEVSPTSCELRQSGSNNVVFTTQPKFKADDKIMSGEKVYECDFSSYNQEGTYYLYSPGIGKTHDFVIGNNAFDDVYRKLARFFYYQRASIDLQPQHAGMWARPAGHMNNDKAAIIHASQLTSPLYNGELIGSTVDVSRGWYDAGDMGKYTITAGPTLFELFSAYELFPAKFTDGQLTIPESGNNIPDLLDEIKWEVDWLKNMQAPDGGVYDRVTTTQWASTMPAQDVAPRYLSEKTTHTTAIYAATMAMAARNFKQYWPEYSADLLSRAEKSWEFLEKHPNPTPAEGYKRDQGIGGGTYEDIDGDADGRAWAAAELYKTTGKQKYNDAFAVYWKQHDPMYGHNPFQHHQQKASFAYATTSFPVNLAFVGEYKKALKFVSDEMYTRTYKQTYRSAYREDVPAWLGWGAYSQSPKYSWTFIKAAILLNNASYLEAAKINLDPILGNNPQYKSYITGVGKDYPKNPLHTISLLDGIGEPVPGLAIYGPTSGANFGNDCANAVTTPNNLYPNGREVTDPYPPLRRYFDIACFVEMSEFSIGDTSQIMPAFAYFSSGSNAGSTLPVQQVPINTGNTFHPGTQQNTVFQASNQNTTFVAGNSPDTSTSSSSSSSSAGSGRSSSNTRRLATENDNSLSSAEQFRIFSSSEYDGDVDYLSTSSRNSWQVPTWVVSLLTVFMLIEVVIISILFVKIRTGIEMPLLERGGFRVYS